jgi:hypothetical protein
MAYHVIFYSEILIFSIDIPLVIMWPYAASDSLSYAIFILKFHCLSDVVLKIMAGEVQRLGLLQ